MYLKSAGPVENGGDTDQTIHSAWSDLGLHCLLWPVCQNNKVNKVWSATIEYLDKYADWK